MLSSGGFTRAFTTTQKGKLKSRASHRPKPKGNAVGPYGGARRGGRLPSPDRNSVCSPCVSSRFMPCGFFFFFFAGPVLDWRWESGTFRLKNKSILETIGQTDCREKVSGTQEESSLTFIEISTGKSNIHFFMPYFTCEQVQRVLLRKHHQHWQTLKKNGYAFGYVINWFGYILIRILIDMRNFHIIQ